MDTAKWLYHAAPLHYLPLIIRDSALYAQSVLTAQGIKPRATAFRRDKMLGLDDYVHLSPRSQTHLLEDKLRKGFAHVLIVFPAQEILALPQTALLPYNTKAWRTRAAYSPVTDSLECARLWYQHTQGRRFPSMEILVKYGLSLTYAAAIAFYSEAERSLTAKALVSLALETPAALVTDTALFSSCGHYTAATLDSIRAYFADCCAAGRILPPPCIPFD